MIHVAVLWPEYLDAVLSGDKIIESRLTRTRRPPFGAVTRGDTVFFKERGGPIRAAAEVKRVESFESLTPTRVDALRRRFGGDIGAPREYWAEKRLARWGTLIWLADVRGVDRGPAHPPFHGRGWLCLGAVSADADAPGRLCRV